MRQFYDLTENRLTTKRVIKEIQELIKEDPDYYDPYLFFADFLENSGEEQKARELKQEAYQRAISRISDKEGNFPSRIEWGWLENRHVVRAIEQWGFQCWEDENTEEALQIFRKLLHSNPNDNIGARHNILAIRLGLSSDYELKFSVKRMPEYLDAFKLSKWFKQNCQQFPDEFNWWFEAVGYKQ